MMIFQKHSLCLAIIFFVGCDNSRHIQYYRTPKKDFGINQAQSSEENQQQVISNLTWDLPKGWIPSKGHSMRLASFDVPFSKGVGDLSIVSLSGISGGLLANVNRWRGQINLDPISENQILEISEAGESKMGAFRIFKMVNNLNKEKAIIAAVLPTGNKTFFIKLTVSQQGLVELESVFEKFCSSIGS
ncbi:hypothetical protein HOA87_02985 [bacterium]|jgi:hypothetical protein|nr:hypothetical protein [bacterium]MBT4248795.1 hypothetical protein [bacterium]MBT4927559.1 hypothetical protein [bacterium]MBT5733816.1 hypothetical protein [bacterium]MBT6018147.1 hypothetical protein [bacterium]